VLEADLVTGDVRIAELSAKAHFFFFFFIARKPRVE